MAIVPHKFKDMSGYPDENLLTVILADNSSLVDKAASKAEMDRRNRRRDFWSKGIVAWIALAIALTSLIWQIVKELWK
ncbi:MAG: hypothetical protein CVU71_03785 [Deltaproteobacteria bacterium HGW-Deltaproteobacteria-6]|jgi:hypothetical protein|nr:MAG: hypothetical protein CVU71_03785 [Deltaproteobacteria bacterium HGW-Deltaproteobacteria-6]